MAIIYGSGGSVTVSGQDSGSGGAVTVGSSSSTPSGPVTWSGQSASQTPFGQLQSGQGQFAQSVARNVGAVESGSAGAISVNSPYVARNDAGQVTGPQGVVAINKPIQLVSGQGMDVVAYNAAYGTAGNINAKGGGQEYVVVTPQAGGGYVVSQNPNLASKPASLSDTIRSMLTSSGAPFKETGEGTFVVLSNTQTSIQEAAAPIRGPNTNVLGSIFRTADNPMGMERNAPIFAQAHPGETKYLQVGTTGVVAQGPTASRTAPPPSSISNQPSLNLTSNTYSEGGRTYVLSPNPRTQLSPNATPQEAVARASDAATTRGATVSKTTDYSSNASLIYKSDIASELDKGPIGTALPAPIKAVLAPAAWLASGAENVAKVAVSPITFIDTGFIAVAKIATDRGASDAARSALTNLKPISQTNPVTAELAAATSSPYFRFTPLPLQVIASGIQTSDIAVDVGRRAAFTGMDATKPVRDFTQSLHITPFDQPTQLKALQAFAEAGPYTAQLPVQVTLLAADIWSPKPTTLNTVEKPVLREQIYAQGKEVASRQGMQGTETFADIIAKNSNTRVLYNVPGAGDVFIQIPASSASRALLVPGELSGSVISAKLIEVPVTQGGLTLAKFAGYGLGAASIQVAANIAAGKPAETDVGKAFFGGLLFYPAVEAVAFASTLPGKAPTSTVVPNPEFKGEMKLYPSMEMKQISDLPLTLRSTGMPEKFAPAQYPIAVSEPLGQQPANMVSHAKSFWDLTDMYPSAIKGRGSQAADIELYGKTGNALTGRQIQITKVIEETETQYLTKPGDLDINAIKNRATEQQSFRNLITNEATSIELGPIGRGRIIAEPARPTVVQPDKLLFDFGIPRLTELEKPGIDVPSTIPKHEYSNEIIERTVTSYKEIPAKTEPLPPETPQPTPKEGSPINIAFGGLPAIGAGLLFPPPRTGGGDSSAFGTRAKVPGQARDLLSISLEAEYRTSKEQPKINYGAGPVAQRTELFEDKRPVGRPPGSGAKAKYTGPKRPVGRPRKNPQQ